MFQQKCINVSDPLKEGIFRMINLNDFIISQKTKDRHQTKVFSWAFMKKKKILLDQLARSAKY